MLGLALSACQAGQVDEQRAAILQPANTTDQRLVHYPGERRLANIRQLTFGGENAEAYFNAEGTELIFQSTREGLGCDQIFRMDVDGRNQRMVSTGLGRTTCGFIFPQTDRIIYSSTHGQQQGCPPKPDYSQGYVWRLQPQLDMYIAGPNGQRPTPFLPHPGYDAEAVVSPQGDRVLFTSTRDGDIDLYSARADGSDLRRLTTEVGYDGGAFFSPDGRKIVYRANHPKTPEALKVYKELLAQDLVRPSVMELFVMNADGSDKRQITSHGAANFAPYFHPDGERIIFSSNMDDPRGRDFELYMIKLDGTGLERITYNPSFDSFPMFSRDGKRLVFASNRNGRRPGETNVFVADWIEQPPTPLAMRLRGQAEIEAQTWLTRAARLADPALEGRGLGSPGLEAAASYIAQQYELIGLRPAGDEPTSYMQRFKVPVAVSVQEATLTVGAQAAKLDVDFRPGPMSSDGQVSAPGVFVGYGIRAPELGHDDYEGMDVSGRVVLALTDSPPSGRLAQSASRYGDATHKAIVARQLGASALILIHDESRRDELMALDEPASSATGLPVVFVRREAARRLWPTLLARLQDKSPDKAWRAESITVKVTLAQRQADVANVVGRLAARADGAPTARALVLGAHYDHLGMGHSSSMRPGQRAAHLGADDNASGVATILELAEALAGMDVPFDVYVVAFTGEESGLLGSARFMERPPLAPSRMVAMMNFDMVGRLSTSGLTIMGVGTAKPLRALVRQGLAQVGLDARLEDTGYGPSDHMSFTLKDVPVLHFFTGLHADYHTPSDTVEKLDAQGGATITALAAVIARQIMDLPAPPQLRQAPGQGPSRAPDASARSYGPYLGSIPSFGQDKALKGALLSGVQPDSPAQRAGLEAGDLIVKFGPDEIQSVQELAMSLRKHKPGDEIEVVVERRGQRVSLKVTLGKR